MIVLAFDQPTATRITSGAQTVVTYQPCHVCDSGPLDMVTAGHDCMANLLESLVGQTVAIARLPEWPPDAVPPFPKGAIVGSARVEACVEIRPGWLLDTTLPRLAADSTLDMSDEQWHFADFTPGRTAVVLTDAAPCEDNCVVCLVRGWIGAHKDHGDPIPWQQDGPIAEWTP